MFHTATVSVSIRPSRHSHALVRDLQEFTVNIPRANDLKIVKFCGAKSGSDVNKFEALGLTPALAPPLISAPMAVEFPISLACRVKQALDLGSHHCFIAEVAAIHVNENLIRPTNRAEPFGSEQLVYLDGKYWSLNLIGQA